MKLPDKIDGLLAFLRDASASSLKNLKNQNSNWRGQFRCGELLPTFLAASALFGAGTSGFAQSRQFLPVYHVVQPGASQSQANTLASDLGIPMSQLSVDNGEVVYV